MFLDLLHIALFPERGGLHSVVSHKSVFGNQEINFAQ